MKDNKRGYLTAAQARAVKTVLDELELKRKAIASELDVSQQDLSGMATGSRRISTIVADGLYSVSNNDPRLDFLQDYEDLKNQNPRPYDSEQTNAWTELYREQVTILSDLYNETDNTGRLSVISGLETLIEQTRSAAE